MRLGLKHRISLPEHAADEIDCCEVEPPVIALTDRPPECCWPAGAITVATGICLKNGTQQAHRRREAADDRIALWG